jgi:hypothetical protein
MNILLYVLDCVSMHMLELEDIHAISQVIDHCLFTGVINGSAIFI